MSLTKYAKKRRFDRTPEPRARAERSRSGHLFVVQKHDASHLHYDFRLELDGALKSWAVPKGPSLDPADKRLAVHVEDHPLSYAKFEGTIPQGEYGGGTVMVWDQGVWTTDDDDPAAALRRGKLSFTLKGTKLKGAWTLTRIREQEGEKRENWLLIKRRDDEAQAGAEPIVDAEPLSVTTGRSIDEIAQGEGQQTPSVGRARKKERKRAPVSSASRGTASGVAKKRSVAGARTRTRKNSASATLPESHLAAIEHARRAPMPHDFSPQLCALADKAPSGDEWIHEIKFDGYRFLAWRTPEGVKLINRSGLDWTSKFRPLADAIEELPIETAILDGEAVILDAQGRSSFQGLQQAIKTRRFERLRFALFDIVYCNGFDLTKATLRDRKALLKRILASSQNETLMYSDHIEGSGTNVEAQACRLGLEGIVSKNADAPYVQRRSRAWLKIKCSHRQEFVVVGFTEPSGGRKHFGALLLGAHDSKGRLVYTGRVGTGFSSASLKEIGAKLHKLEQEDSPLDVAPTRAEQVGAHWVTPELVGEVEFKEWTDDGRLRQPAFQGLREDKQAESVVIEAPGVLLDPDESHARVANGLRAAPASAPMAAAESHASAKQRTRSKPRAVNVNGSSKRRGKESTVAGVRISNPDRLVFPEERITKLELAEYYERVSDLIMPFVAHRALSTLRCPQGRAHACFFQKHLGATFAPPVFPLRIKEKEDVQDYLSIDSKAGLITLIQFGVIEIHPWGSRADKIEQPDMLTFDLDPDEGVGFDDVKAGAVRVRDVLAELGLESFLKTSGGKGLHVVVPLQRHAVWEEAKEFAGDVSRSLASAEPDRYVATMSKQKRRGKIFIDYLRNGRGATSVAPYSVRARAGAPISVPIAWSELGALKSAAAFTIRTLGNRLDGKRADPWKEFATVRQRLTASMRKAVAGA